MPGDEHADLTVRIDDSADQAVRIVGNQVLDLSGAAAGELVVVGAGETLDTRTLVDGDIPAAIARDAEVTAAVAAEASARATADALLVAKATYDANTILIATANDTPIALTVGASTIVGRKASGDIVALTAAELMAILAAAAEPLSRSAPDFHGLAGSPSQTILGSVSANRSPVWALDAATQESIGRIDKIPANWATVNVDVEHVNHTADAGDVVLRLDTTAWAAGGTIDANTLGTPVTVTAAAQYVPTVTRMATGLAVDPTKRTRFTIVRVAADVADTKAGDHSILGMTITRAS